jgi:hypothetical protein
VVDGKQNAVYVLWTTFTSGTAYPEMPGDSGVASAVGPVNPSTGTITPIAVGFGSPTGLRFVPG